MRDSTIFTTNMSKGRSWFCRRPSQPPVGDYRLGRQHPAQTGQGPAGPGCARGRRPGRGGPGIPYHLRQPQELRYQPVRRTGWTGLAVAPAGKALTSRTGRAARSAFFSATQPPRQCCCGWSRKVRMPGVLLKPYRESFIPIGVAGIDRPPDIGQDRLIGEYMAIIRAVLSRKPLGNQKLAAFLPQLRRLFEPSAGRGSRNGRQVFVDYRQPDPSALFGVVVFHHG